MKKFAPLLVATLATATLLSSAGAGYSVARQSGAPAAAAASESVMTTPTATRKALEPCADLPSLPTAKCGWVTVPLDRTDPDAETTEIAFVLVPRTDRSRPGLGTIVPNPGGPGTSSIDATGALFTAALAPLMDRRDVLLIDPRGVGRSAPSPARPWRGGT